MVVRAVTFDAVGTLLAPRESVGVTYARVAACHGLAADPIDLETCFAEAFRRAPPLCFPGVPPREVPQAERAWWRAVVARVFAFADPERVEVVFEELFAYYGEAKAWKVFDDVRPTVAALHERGIVLGIVSNFDARLWAVCAQLGLADWFRAIVVSSRAGAAKPNPEIFRVALAQFGVDPAATLHVGDSWEDDVCGAAAAGMRALWLRRGRPPGSPGIATLHEVLAYIRSAPEGQRS